MKIAPTAPAVAHGKGKGHEVTVDDGEVISGEKFPLVFDHGPVRPMAKT